MGRILDGTVSEKAREHGIMTLIADREPPPW